MTDLTSTTWHTTIQDSMLPAATASLTSAAAPLASELLRLQDLIVSESGAIAAVPRQIKKIVTKHSSKFVGNSQEDAHEFFLDLINVLHEELYAMRNIFIKHWKKLPRATRVLCGEEVVVVEEGVEEGEGKVEGEAEGEEADDDEQERARELFECLPTTRNLHAEVQVTLQCKGCHQTHQGTSQF